MITAVYCDYGGVVADHYSEPYLGALADALGTNRRTARDLLSEKSLHGKLYRLGKLSTHEFWEEVRTLAPRKDFNSEHLQEVWAKTYVPNLAVLGLLRFLRVQCGIRTGIVMNEDRARYDYILRTYALDDIVSDIIASFAVGLVKPDPAIYSLMLERSGNDSKPSELLYVDDRQSHIDPARALGAAGYLYTGAGAFSTFIGEAIESGSIAGPSKY